jgi:hypothetical protein
MPIRMAGSFARKTAIVGTIVHSDYCTACGMIGHRASECTTFTPNSRLEKLVNEVLECTTLDWEVCARTLKYSTSPSLGSRLTRLYAFAPAVRLRGRTIIGVDVDELSRQLTSPRFCLCVVPSLPAGAPTAGAAALLWSNSSAA